MTAPPELQDIHPDMPTLELLRKAFYFWRSSRGHEDELADTIVWSDAIDALLERLVEERPELRWSGERAAA